MGMPIYTCAGIYVYKEKCPAVKYYQVCISMHAIFNIVRYNFLFFRMWAWKEIPIGSRAKGLCCSQRMLKTRCKSECSQTRSSNGVTYRSGTWRYGTSLAFTNGARIKFKPVHNTWVYALNYSYHQPTRWFCGVLITKRSWYRCSRAFRKSGNPSRYIYGLRFASPSVDSTRSKCKFNGRF